MIKTPLTGVDRSTCFTLCFPELGAQAQLSCNINVPSNGLSATLCFRHPDPGAIVLSEIVYRAILERPGSCKVHREETTHFDVPRHGSHFEADEIAH